MARQVVGRGARPSRTDRIERASRTARTSRTKRTGRTDRTPRAGRKAPALCFFSGVYHDQPLARRLVRQLARHYPDADRLLVSDGDHDPAFAADCQAHGARYWAGERLKLMERGGAWVRRMLETYLDASRARRLVRVEPDTCVNWPLGDWPAADVCANWRVTRDGRVYFQGGCLALTRAAVERMLADEELRGRRYAAIAFAYQRYGETYAPAAGAGPAGQASVMLSATDIILTDLIMRLGLSVANLPQADCWGPEGEQYRHRRNDPTFAFVHPVSLDQCAE